MKRGEEEKQMKNKKWNKSITDKNHRLDSILRIMFEVLHFHAFENVLKRLLANCCCYWSYGHSFALRIILNFQINFFQQHHSLSLALIYCIKYRFSIFLIENSQQELRPAQNELKKSNGGFVCVWNLKATK